MSCKASEHLIIYLFQCSRPFRVLKRLDALKFLRNRNRKRKSLHAVEAPKELHTAEGKRIRLIRDSNLTANIREPVVMACEVGWSLSGHSALSSALESPVTTPLLVKQGGRLVQALFEILLAVLQRFHAPLQQEVVLLQARCGCIWRRGFDLLRLYGRDSFALSETANATRQASGRLGILL